jgi:hypothetical protein
VPHAVALCFVWIVAACNNAVTASVLACIAREAAFLELFVMPNAIASSFIWPAAVLYFTERLRAWTGAHFHIISQCLT